MSIAQNIAAVKARIAEACERVGRNPSAVKLIAVSKTVGVPQIREAVSAGVSAIGENRVQEAWRKFQEVAVETDWHMIGHLQTNKVRQVLKFATLIHTVDSLRLANEIQVQAQRLDRKIAVLLQVNISGEASKFGFGLDEVVDVVPEVRLLPNLSLQGLMTIGAHVNDPSYIRTGFSALRELRDKLEMEQGSGLVLPELSMGMTNDFELAVEEGSTMVRIGRSIFGERNQQLSR